MRFETTYISGLYVIELSPFEDERGGFARIFCEKEFKSLNLHTKFVQHNLSWNKKRGTLRGLHYQVPPWEEVKVVRVTKGAIWDVVVDLRKDSPTRFKHFSIEINDRNRKALYIPKGFAHGFVTLEDNTEVLYLMGEFYKPEAARGIRYNDPFFAIRWPIEIKVISEKDKNWPLFDKNVV